MAVKTKSKVKAPVQPKQAKVKKEAPVKAKSLSSEKKSPLLKKSAAVAVIKKKASSSEAQDKVRVVHHISAPRSSFERKGTSKGSRAPQFNYMKAPGIAHDFQVGDTVEVYCDHDKNRERVRGWIAGIVVQVDNKMVAVQFRSNVYLTDGWMVPDRILWYPLNSEHIRPFGSKKNQKKDEKVVIPEDY
jgi:hypothetical protein